MLLNLNFIFVLFRRIVVYPSFSFCSVGKRVEIVVLDDEVESSFEDEAVRLTLIVVWSLMIDVAEFDVYPVFVAVAVIEL